MKSRRSQLLFAIAIIGALLFSGVLAREHHRREDAHAPLPFEPSEELVYVGEINKSLLRGIDIAELRFTAERTPLDAAQAKDGRSNAETRLRFTAEAVTKGLFRKLFGLRFHQRIESTVEPSSFTVLQTTKMDEQGDRQRESKAIFDRSAGKVVWTERDPNDPSREPRVVTSEFSGVVQDVASVFYFLRTQPLSPGKRFEITLSDSGRIYRFPVVVVEKKKMKTVLGEVSTLRLDPEVFGEGRLLQSEGKFSVWLTDDARHIPVQARLSTDRGTLNIKLKSMTNNGVPAKAK